MPDINPAWTKLKESVSTGDFFSLTLQETALERLDHADESDVVRLAVIGDIGIVNAPSVVRHLCMTLAFFMARKNVQVVTTSRPGTDEIVVNACKRNGVDYLVLKPDPYIFDDIERRVALLDKILEESDALLVIVQAKSKAYDNFIERARNRGLAVVKRTVRKPTDETQNT